MNAWLAQGQQSGGPMLNPAAAAIMANSGALAVGWYDINACMVGDALHWYFYLAHHAAGPGALLSYWPMTVQAHGHMIIELRNWKIAANEVFLLTNAALAAGNYVGNIWYSKRA